MNSKLCKHCNTVKTLNCFVKRNDRSNCYRSICKECKVVNNRLRQKENMLYFQNNKKSILNKRNIRRNNNLNERISCCLRSRFYQAIKNNHKSGSAVRDLGCSIEEFKVFLESKFTEGMTWDNYGSWHIDHIIPLSKLDLTKHDNIVIGCHYTNLQPLWARDNLSKGNRVL
jgi:hypothetical protein